MIALELSGFSVRRGGREVLRVDSLGVAPGETLVVLGPNGAGKSSLLLGAALLLPPGGGTVSLFGETARGGRDRVRLRRLSATVFQEPALLDMSARRNVETALWLHGLPAPERRARAEHWLGRLGVADLARARPHTLSGGEAQRVALARAFAVEPRLLFLDEPFSSLDPATRAELAGELRGLLAERRATTLLVTHDLGEAELLADRVAVLLDGELAQEGAVARVFDRPRSPAVAGFLGYALVRPGQLPPGLCRAAGIEVSAAMVGVRPSAVQVVVPAGSDNATTDHGGAVATVASVQGAAGHGRLVLDIGDALLAVDLDVRSARSLRPGDRVGYEIDPAGLVGW